MWKVERAIKPGSTYFHFEMPVQFWTIAVVFQLSGFYHDIAILYADFPSDYSS